MSSSSAGSRSHSLCLLNPSQVMRKVQFVLSLREVLADRIGVFGSVMPEFQELSFSGTFFWLDTELFRKNQEPPGRYRRRNSPISSRLSPFLRSGCAEKAVWAKDLGSVQVAESVEPNGSSAVDTTSGSAAFGLVVGRKQDAVCCALGTSAGLALAT